MMKNIKETLELALEALEAAISDDKPYIVLSKEAIIALREALADEALDRMAENARELGLDYEQPTPVQQEPVACKHEWFRTGAMEDGQCRCINCGTWNTITPAQRKPLTDEEILHLVDTHVGAPSMAYPLDSSDWINFSRAIEAAHGITAAPQLKENT